MKKKNLLRLMALAAAVIMLFTACGKEEPKETTPATQAETKATEQKTTKPPKTQNRNEEIYGVFYYTDDDITLEFDGVENFVMTGTEGTWEGTYTWDGEDLLLTDAEGNEEPGGIDEDGTLFLSNYAGWFVTEDELEETEIIGQWGQYGEEFYVTFYDDGTAEVEWEGDTDIYTYEVDDDEVIQFYDGDMLVDQAVLDDEDRLILDSMPDQWLLLLEDYPDSVSDEYDLEPNWEYDTGIYTLEDGGRWRTKDESSRGLIPIDWEAILESDTINEDGNRVMEISLISGYPVESYPSIDSGTYTRWHIFYDYDTGEKLIEDSEVMDNNMEVQFETPNGLVTLKISEAKETGSEYEEWEDGWKIVRTYDLIVEMPEWYHGLMLSAITIPEYNEDYNLEAESITDDSVIEHVEDGLRMRID